MSRLLDWARRLARKAQTQATPDELRPMDLRQWADLPPYHPLVEPSCVPMPR